ncbi:hypothetical protein TthTF19_14400 [Thermus thermophilus]|uniref:hypothetical protein n=1 Tax=Thermus thermophilus TaxID=274 RepID=UPI00324AFB23
MHPSKWSFLVYQERQGLLGAACLLHPGPFEALKDFTDDLPGASLEALGALAYDVASPAELEEVMKALERRPLRGENAYWVLEDWRKRAWFAKARFPEAWRGWAYPILAEVALEAREAGTSPAKMLEAAFFFRVEGWAERPYPPPDEPPPEPWLGESKSSYLERAGRYYDEYQERLKAVPREVAPSWATRKRDLLLLALKEVEGLSYAQVLQRADELMEDPILGKYLRQKGGSASSEDGPNLDLEVLSKAIKRTKRWLGLE